MHPLDVIEATASLWARRRAGPALHFERPDVLDRCMPAVDLLGRDSLDRAWLVLEHTLVESFLDQHSKQIAATTMFKPLETLLSGRLPGPGWYSLVVRPGDVLGLKRATQRVRDWTAEWIRTTAPTLALGSPQTAPHHFATTAVPDTALEVSLYRWPGEAGRFGLVLAAPEEGSPVLAPSLEKAIGAKCPKLATAKAANPGATSLLLLEISDIALGSVFDLDAVIQVRLAAPWLNTPDDIWLVDTSGGPPSVMISKQGAQIGDVLGERFLPFALR